MLIFIYAFCSFLFFKIMPEFLLPASNSLAGAFLMGIISAGCMFATTLALNSEGLRAIDACIRRHDGRPDLWGLVPRAAAGIGVSVGICYLIGIGFSQTLMLKTFGWRGDPLWFWVMLCIPPIIHCAIISWDIFKLARQVRHIPD